MALTIISKLYDSRIDSENVLIEIDMKSYLELARKIVGGNEFQRARVKSSKTVYSLLKKDLRRGCILPPIVLAFCDFKIEGEITAEVIEQAINEKKLIILDGLQRTFTMRDLVDDLTLEGSLEDLERFHNMNLRIELYHGISRLAILYRMLTLNTGQTPMSLRHQIEILYSDYMLRGVDGIALLRETDDRKPAGIGDYIFREVIDGFNSYINRSEFPIDRSDLLENIDDLEDLSKEEISRDVDLFREFIKTFNHFLVKMDSLAPEWIFDKNKAKDMDIPLTSLPFGNSIFEIFPRSQVIAGFGSAVGKLKDFEQISGFDEINGLIDQVKLQDPKNLYKLLGKLDEIRNNAKKIGNAQRSYFHYIFREVFNKNSDSYLDLDSAIETAYKKYLSLV